MNSVYCAAATALIALLPAQSVAAEAKCLTRAELRTGIAYVMPALMKGVVSKCAPTLAEDSYLAKDGEALIARYAGQSQGSAEDVQALFAKFGPQAGLNGADGESTAKLVESLVTVGVQSALKPESCADISAAMALLDPLPAENMNGLIELVLVKVDEDSAMKRAKSASGAKDKRQKASDKRPSKPFLCGSLAVSPAQ
jgi:hypothetical protein